MQVPENASQPHPGLISQGHLHLKMYVSHPYRSFLTSRSQDYCLTPSMHRLTSTHVPKFFNSCCISPPTRPWCWHLTSIHFMSHIHPGQEDCSSAPSQFHLYTYPGLKMCVSTQSRSHLTPKSQYMHSISTQAPTLTHPLHSDHISPQSISL